MKFDDFLRSSDIKLFRFAIIVGAMVATMMWVTSSRGDEPSQRVIWTSSYSEAVQQARQQDTPIMLFFAGSDWCPWCKKLQQEVFDSNAFAAWSDARVVTVIVDFPRKKSLPTPLAEQNNSLLKKYRQFLNGFPTALFIRPDGVVIGKMGYEPDGVLSWIDKAQKLVGTSDKVAQRTQLIR